MSAWPEKFVIGLTGNIGTGKSVVRKMLEHLGAFGIDADVLSHRVMMPGAPGYQPVLESFGKLILDADGIIERATLGQLIFPDPDALDSLEAILHPLIRQGIDQLVQRANKKIVVIEAIKLLEGGLYNSCDVIWVVHVPEEIQMARLTQIRGMDAAAVQARIAVQGTQADKINAADITIQNGGSIEETWEQVQNAWNLCVGFEQDKPTPVPKTAIPKTDLSVEFAGPQAADSIAEFMTLTSRGQREVTGTDVMIAFGEKAFVLLRKGDQIVGLMGWQVENLIARIDEVFLLPDQPLEGAAQLMINAIEEAVHDLRCEASLLFLPPEMANQMEPWKGLGYTVRTIKSLEVRAWQAAAMESMPLGTALFFKQLRQDRILRPI